MILADKIILLRKKAGWSQEELAEQLGVSRQSVSKWEGAQSIPDMDKILQMSRLFGVSTDYLLKDEIEQIPQAEPAAEPGVRRVTMEMASDYLERRRVAAPRMAIATFMCVISPVMLILLAGISELPGSRLTENAAAGIGLGTLLVLIAIAVAIFISCGSRVRDYEFLDNQPFETEYGVTGMVKERKSNFAATYSKLNITGTVVCILSVMPLIIIACLEMPDIACIASVCFLLLAVGLACIAFVYAGVRMGAMQRLLEEGDFERRHKEKSGITGACSLIYWMIVTAVYLVTILTPWGQLKMPNSWIIWPVAGVLYGAFMAVIGIIERCAKK